MLIVYELGIFFFFIVCDNIQPQPSPGKLTMLMDLMQNYVRAHLRGLGVSIFQAKNVPWKMLITVSKYQVHSCFSVKLEVAILQ